jgi:hypothetical protein
MNRRRILAAGSLALLVAVAGGAVAWSAGLPAAGSDDRVTSQLDDVGIAGPLGPQAIAAVPSYFKRVSFTPDQSGQSHVISTDLPIGRYLVEVLTPSARHGRSPDCLGISFPLVPPVDGVSGFRGYVSVTTSDKAAAVSCYEPASATNSTVTYELYYIPATVAQRIGERS